MLFIPNLTDADSTSVFFIFICDLTSSIRENKARDIIFEVMIESEIYDRLDLLAELWEQFNSRNKDLKKQVSNYLKLKIRINQTLLQLH